MTLRTFIQQDILLRRVKQSGVLVVYDPERHYQELCLELRSVRLEVIDVSEGSIAARLAALEDFAQLASSQSPLEGLIIYVPESPPITDEQKQRDPFAAYGASGAVFPQGDGDEYLSLCLKAYPDYATEVRRIFATNRNPSFAVIDAVARGSGWPNLQALLKVESARDILFALLAPSDAQKDALRGETSWIDEATELFRTALGLKLQTKVRSWAAVGDELWRFLLFSEFGLDLGENLPPALATVPCAAEEARDLVHDLCERLRDDRRAQNSYFQRAEMVEKDLNLPALCRGIEPLGVRNTFPFQERAALSQAADALRREDMDRLGGLLRQHGESIWATRGENEAQWTLISSASDLVQACDQAGLDLPGRSRTLDDLVDYYAGSLSELDRLQREFEEAAVDVLNPQAPAHEVIEYARDTYRKVADKVQDLFIRHVEKVGWPLLGRLSNTEVFDNLVAPSLMESGHRVAYFLVDAMRYELGAQLARELQDAGQVGVQIACAQMPTVTLVGMASLMPKAEQGLRLLNKDGELLPALGDRTLGGLRDRMVTLRGLYGQRFAETDLSSFVREAGQIDPAVELLVLRSNEMDSDFESNPESAPGLISHTFQKIRAAIDRLREFGFQEAVLASDHGFFLNTAMGPGDVCSKPSGTWVEVHGRALLGDGSSDAANLVLGAAALGIKGDFHQVAIPRALVAYRAGQPYFHGGLSLQEALVPVISIHLRQAERGFATRLTVSLTYRRDSKKVTTHLPVIDVEGISADLFAGETEVLIEAFDNEGNVVGEAKPGGAVDPATRLVTLQPGQRFSVTIKMDMNFEGKFVIKALEPTTQAALGDPLELETDYTV